eukprot:GCRY01001410.1.p1 GENE.GCRY01001410.1~~GCRY01001410.1.p1  ORF type:complete len:184 (+),score=32.33 GCRY01001410.1:72-623(+)
MSLNDAAFRAQFDPSSPSYHHGSTVPVPIGGHNIPQGMADDGSPSLEAEKPQSYGPRYEELMKARSDFTILKKKLQSFNLNVEILLRLKDQSASESKLAEAVKAIEVSKDDLLSMKPCFEVESGGKFVEEIDKVVTLYSAVTVKSEPAYAEYAKAQLLLSRGIATEQRNLLVEIKKEKQKASN